MNFKMGYASESITCILLRGIIRFSGFQVKESQLFLYLWIFESFLKNYNFTCLVSQLNCKIVNNFYHVSTYYKIITIIR